MDGLKTFAYVPWPNVSNPLAPTPADHAAHSPLKGIPHPHDIGMDDKKAVSKLYKGARKMPKARKTMPKKRKH
jgi:hypothetical protein